MSSFYFTFRTKAKFFSMIFIQPLPPLHPNLSNLLLPLYCWANWSSDFSLMLWHFWRIRFFCLEHSLSHILPTSLHLYNKTPWKRCLYSLSPVLPLSLTEPGPIILFHSSAIALVVTNHLHVAKFNGQLISFDLSAAFGTVDHSLPLWNTLFTWLPGYPLNSTSLDTLLALLLLPLDLPDL